MTYFMANTNFPIFGTERFFTYLHNIIPVNNFTTLIYKAKSIKTEKMEISLEKNQFCAIFCVVIKSTLFFFEKDGGLRRTEKSFFF